MHLEELSCSYYWKREELGYEDMRGEARLKSSNKSASLSIQLQLVSSSEEILNEALENSSADIAEDMRIAEARELDAALSLTTLP